MAAIVFMKLLKYKLLKDFWKKHSDAEAPLNRWAEFVESNDWKNHADLKEAFPSADYVGNNRYVFNISGNKYRLITVVVLLAELNVYVVSSLFPSSHTLTCGSPFCGNATDALKKSQSKIFLSINLNLSAYESSTSLYL